MEERIREFAEEGLEKRLGTYGYVNKDICYKPYTEGFEDGYKKGLEAKINMTTISDCPIKDDQLTEAKEIIKELLSSCFGYNSKTVNYEVKAKAQAFLEE